MHQTIWLKGQQFVASQDFFHHESFNISSIYSKFEIYKYFVRRQNSRW